MDSAKDTKPKAQPKAKAKAKAQANAHSTQQHNAHSTQQHNAHSTQQHNAPAKSNASDTMTPFLQAIDASKKVNFISGPSSQEDYLKNMIENTTLAWIVANQLTALSRSQPECSEMARVATQNATYLGNRLLAVVSKV
jgi:hypothetical protein